MHKFLLYTFCTLLVSGCLSPKYINVNKKPNKLPVPCDAMVWHAFDWSVWVSTFFFSYRTGNLQLTVHPSQPVCIHSYHTHINYIYIFILYIFCIVILYTFYMHTLNIQLLHIYSHAIHTWHDTSMHVLPSTHTLLDDLVEVTPGRLHYVTVQSTESSVPHQSFPK